MYFIIFLHIEKESINFIENYIKLQLFIFIRFGNILILFKFLISYNWCM